jgi:uncharacterized repeat protein (TIGR01451 family)
VSTSTFWKRATLGAGLLAALLTGVPHAMAAGRFHLPYGDGLNSQPTAGSGRLQHGYGTPPPASSGRFGPPGSGSPGSSGRPSADLQLSNTSAPNPATQGGRFDYTLTVTNAGPAPTTDVNLSDDLPSGARLIQAATTQGTCSPSQQYVRCALGTLDGGRNATVTITVNAVQNGSIYNTASVTGREYDPYEGNNTATAVTNVQPGGQWAADLSVGNTVDHPTATAGDTLTYTITVANAGPALAVGTHLNDQLPNGAQFVSAAPSQGTCSPSGTDVVCELGNLASAATATVTVVVRADQPGTAVNVAYVTSQMLDQTSSDNQAQATSAVVPAGGGTSVPGGSVPGRSARSGRGTSAPGPASAVRIRPTNDGYVF